MTKSDPTVVIGSRAMLSEMKVTLDNKNRFNLRGALVLPIVLVAGVSSQKSRFENKACCGFSGKKDMLDLKGYLDENKA